MNQFNDTFAHAPPVRRLGKVSRPLGSVTCRATYLESLTALNELDGGGVNRTAFTERAESVREPAVLWFGAMARLQPRQTNKLSRSCARPVQPGFTYSRDNAAIRRRDGITACQQKDAQHSALRVFWLGIDPPRPNRVQLVKHSLSNSLALSSRSGEDSFAPDALQRTDGHNSKASESAVIHRCESFPDGGFLCGTKRSDSEPKRFA